VKEGRDLSDEREEMVKIASVANEPLARMWAELLERNGIPCLVKDVRMGIGGVWTSALDEHEIYVRADQAEEAAALLTPYDGPKADLTVERPE
jgi:hypothetical protein